MVVLLGNVKCVVIILQQNLIKINVFVCVVIQNIKELAPCFFNGIFNTLYYGLYLP